MNDSSLLVSANSSKSLPNYFDFENQVLTDSQINSMPIEDVKHLLDLARFMLNAIKVERSNFIVNTNLRENTAAYKKVIAELNMRKDSVNRNYIIIESRLKREKDLFRNSEIHRIKAEGKFLFFFFKTAKENLSAEDFIKIFELTEKIEEMPESLKGRA